MRDRLRALFSRGAEALLAVVFVLVFFLVFMVILWWSFPKGVGLGSAIRSMAPTAARSHEISVPGEHSRWVQTVARLATVNRSVKNKLADSIVWSNANEGLELGAQDAVQTFSESGASIAFERDQKISLSENSLVVIRRLEQDPESGSRRASVVLLGGALEGSVGSGASGCSSVEVVAGKTATSIAPRGAGQTKFRIATSPDDTSSISILSGHADLRVGDRVVSVGAGQTVRVTAQGAVLGPRAIANAPVLVAPEDGAVVRSRVLPVDVVFSWKGDAANPGYRFQIARDPSFREPIFDRRVTDATAHCPDLPAGRFYWRVRASDGMADGQIAAPRSLEVAVDAEPPSLRVAFPEGALEHGVVPIRGTTEPGASVFIESDAVPVSADGSFEKDVVLRRGAQVVVVEAVDAAGNVAYASRTLVAR